MHDIEPRLAIHDRLTFHREPGNPYDPQAIRVQMEDGTKIGYVPRQDNVIFANLMDAGKLLFGRITKKERCGSWLHISIGIYLQDWGRPCAGRNGAGYSLASTCSCSMISSLLGDRLLVVADVNAGLSLFLMTAFFLLSPESGTDMTRVLACP